jgi:hypothetical protein
MTHRSAIVCTVTPLPCVSHRTTPRAARPQALACRAPVSHRTFTFARAPRAVARPTRAVRVRAAGEPEPTQLKTSEKVAIGAALATAVLGTAAYVYGLDDVQVAHSTLDTHMSHPELRESEACLSSNPLSLGGWATQDLLYGDGLGGYGGGVGLGDVTGSLLWSCSLYYASPVQLVLLFLGRIDTDRPSDAVCRPPTICTARTAEARRTAMSKLRSDALGFGSGRHTADRKTALERGTTPRLPRRT